MSVFSVVSILQRLTFLTEGYIKRERNHHKIYSEIRNKSCVERRLKEGKSVFGDVKKKTCYLTSLGYRRHDPIFLSNPLNMIHFELHTS